MAEQWNMQQPPSIDPEDLARRQLSSAQTLTTIAFVSAPVSLIIGGVLLAAVALICALVARSKVRQALASLEEPSPMAGRLYTQSWIAVIVSLFAFAANAVFLALMLPALMDLMQNGDPQALMDSLSAAGGGSSSASTSIWG